MLLTAACVAACSGEPLDPDSTSRISIKDMVVAASVEQIIRVRGPNGGWISGTQSSAGTLNLRNSVADLRPTSPFRVQRESKEDAVALRRTVAKSPKLAFQILNAKGPNGERQRIGLIKEANKRLGESPRGVIVYSGARPASVLAFDYVTINGRQIPKQIRLSLLDSLTLEVISEMTVVNSQIEQIAVSNVTSALKDVVAVVRRELSPKALHAAEEEVTEFGCWRELWELGVESARLTKMGIDYFALALSCAQEVVELDIVNCLNSLTIMANLLRIQAEVVGLKAALLAVCRESYTPPITGGGGDDGNYGEYDWCNYTFYYDAEGGIIDIEENYCGYGTAPSGDNMS